MMLSRATRSDVKTPSPEAPLSALWVGVLVVSATALVLCFYAACLLALLLIIGLVLVDAALLIGLTRVGLGGWMVEPIRCQVGLAGLLLQSLDLRGRDVDWGLWLAREDAPRLWETVRAIAGRVGVPPPDRLLLEMNANAWVRLHGYRRGRGACTLGVGFDLLAAMTQGQIETVLAHEMAHAKLIQRGYKGWLGNGVARIVRLYLALQEAIDRARGENRKFWTARLLARGAHAFARTGTRLVAAYSRQDEFAADRGAATLCGADLYRETLLLGDVVGQSEADLSDRARLLQTQREGSFSAWLRAQLLPDTPEKRGEIERKALAHERRDPYDTHPLLRDRLAALPAQSDAPKNSESDVAKEQSALDLLSDADELALRLIEALEHTANEEERVASEQMRRWIRKHTRASHLTPPQVLGWILLFVGGIGAAMGLGIWNESGMTSFDRFLSIGVPLAIAAPGVWMMRHFRWRESTVLPVPPLADLLESARSESRRGDVETQLHSLEIELRNARPDNLKNRRARVRYWAEVAYGALAVNDYARALVAARIGLSEGGDDFENLLARGVALAYFGQSEEAEASLGAALQRYGLGTSLSWALGWSLWLLSEWQSAEPYLLEATARRPDAATLWSLLGLCQARTERTRQAIGSVRRAVELEPDEIKHHSLLMNILVDAGRARDALPLLEILDAHRPHDRDVMVAGARTELLLGRSELAEGRLSALRARHADAETELLLAHSFAESNWDERARDAYENALQRAAPATLPAAHIGLARLASKRHDEAATRSHLLTAIDLTSEVAPEADGPFDVLITALQGLTSQGEPIEKAGAWSAHFSIAALPERAALEKALDLPPVPSPDVARPQRFSMLICAADRDAARAWAQVVYGALFPDALWPDAAVSWEESPDDRPDGPIVPGIYGFVFS